MASAPPDSGGGISTGQALQAGGGLIRGIAGFQTGKANARFARAEARAAVRQGVAESDDIRMQARRVAGEAIAAMGGHGAQIGTGSALDVLRDIEVESGLDRMRVQARAHNTAQARNAQAKLYRRQGAWNLIAGVADGAAAMAGGGA